MSRIAFVTGAAGGIGEAICQRLVASGYEVYGGDVSIPDEDRRSDRFVVGPLDIRSGESVQSAVRRAAALGPIHAVVNCAGIVRSTPVADALDETAASDVWSVNVAGMARVLHAVSDHLADGSGVVNIGSVTGSAGRLPGASLYGATKAGVEAYTRYLACELAPRVRVNAVVPGYIRVPMSASMKAVSGGEEKLIEQVPLRRLGEPSEIADAVDFLLSDRASYITGAVLVVDGGVLAW